MAAEDFIITRKRKKYKFARFEELNNCYDVEQLPATVLHSFVTDAPLVIELGAGTSDFLVEQALLQPTQRFIAIDVKADRLYTGAMRAVAEQVDNIIFVKAHADQLTDIFTPQSIAELWLTFSDPFPKKRHSKHRMTHQHFLQIYRNILQPGGTLHFKTDNFGLFSWSLERFVEQEFALRHLFFDLHDSNAPSHYKIMTTYEKRYAAEGLPIYSVDCVF